MRIHHLFTLVLYHLFTLSVIAQQPLTPTRWSSIERSLRTKKNLDSTYSQLIEIKASAQKDHDPASLARADCYLMLLQDQRSEDTFYFRNSAYIDSLLQSSQDTTLKGLMHYLQAQRLWRFTAGVLKFNYARYERKDLYYNYAAYSVKERDSIINDHFYKARTAAASLQAEKKEPPLEKVLWLSSRPLSFLFSPSLTDIVFLEQIVYRMSRYGARGFDLKRARNWLSLSQDAFIDTLRQLSGASAVPILSLYGEWITQNRQLPSRYSIEVLARHYVYNELENENDLELQQLWEAYLLSLCASPYREVKAKGIFHLCFLYKTWAAKYPSQTGSYQAHSDKPYDPRFQYYGVKALDLYERHKSLFDAFHYLQHRLERLYELRDPLLRVNLQTAHEPDKPLLLQVEYQNVPNLYYRIVPLNHRDNLYAVKPVEPWLLKKVPVRTAAVSLPLPTDLNLHRTFLKLEPLPVGRYCLLFSYDSSFEAQRISYQTFQVSGLAALSAEDRVYVVHRSTGLPITKATVEASYMVEKKIGKTKHSDTLYHHLTTNDKGFVVLPKQEDYHLRVAYKGDTLGETAEVSKERLSDDVYTKDDYDDLAEYYDDNTTVEIFTDRSLYRPGQQVHFKALFMTKDAKSGTDQLMTKAHLKRGFQNWLKKWIRERKPQLLLHDPFDRTIDTLNIALDDYGTVSGTFTIPLQGATGTWQIEPDDQDLGRNRGTFQVEHYKRPTFELTVDKPVKALHIGDTLQFSLHLHSFAGSVLVGPPVSYRVEKTSWDQGASGTYTEDFSSATTTSDQQGNILIKIWDSTLQNADKEKDLTFTYRLNATATNATGETHEVNASLKLATRPVVIRLPLSSTCNLADLRPLLITTSDVNGVETQTMVEVQLIKISPEARSFVSDKSGYADQWVHTPEELFSWFPTVKFQTTEEWEAATMIKKMTLSTGLAEKFRWPLDSMTPGTYRVVAACVENGIETGRTEKLITIFQPGATGLPNTQPFFFHLPANYLFKGDTLTLFSGAPADTTHTILHLKYYRERKGKTILENTYIERILTKGIHTFKWKLPDGIRDRLMITEIGVKDNSVLQRSEEVDIAPRIFRPQIIIEQFRSTLTPGATATYAVSIKTKDQPTAAQLMTTIYDATLDIIRPHRWQIPYREGSPTIRTAWTYRITEGTGSSLIAPTRSSKTTDQQPLWWLTTGITGGVTEVVPQRMTTDNPLLALEGRVPGLLITNATGIDGFVLSDTFEETTRRFNTGNVSRVKIQGTNSVSLEAYKQPLVILDGVPYTGNLGSINIKEVTEIMILKDADATAIYGSRGAAGVLLISTKGEIKLPVVKQEPVVKVRSNFNETAFFAPAIYADKEGFYKFTFTMPESLTEWNWKLLAHTKALEFAYAERKLISQLPLMVQPSVPALLYQGDRIILKSQISNTDTASLSGQALCKIEDAVTGEDLTNRLVGHPSAPFTLQPKSKTVVPFELTVPDSLFHPLKITFTAKTPEMADGEEHMIPILSREQLVWHQQRVTWKGSDTTLVKPDSIRHLFGVALSLPDNPQTALLFSLPYLAGYPFDCAEQLLNKLYAHVVARNLMRTDRWLQDRYQNVKGVLEIPDTTRSYTPVNAQAMPWLDFGTKTFKENQQALELLDTLKAREKIHDYLGRLMALQNDDGGIPWFQNGRSDYPISLYILERFQKLKRQEQWAPDPSHLPRRSSFDDFIKKLVSYCDQQWLGATHLPQQQALVYCSVRSLYNASHPLNRAATLKMDSVLRHYWQQDLDWSLREQALLSIATLRHFSGQDTLYNNALDAIRSIRQQAIRDTVNGIRWKALADGDVLGGTTEETLSYLLEAFDAAGETKSMEPGVLQWLLTQQQVNQWQTTTGTAAMISMLRREKKPMQGEADAFTAQLPDTSLFISNALFVVNRFVFHQLAQLPSLSLHKRSTKPMSATIGWYHYAESTAAEGSNGVHIFKKIDRYNEALTSWEPVTITTVLKPGDKVQITLTIETPKALQYVYVRDPNAAPFEPSGYNSGYRWGQSFSYYESTGTAERNFFASFIPSGRTTLHYEMKVTQVGRFSSGRASLQCLYQPELAAYSNNQPVEVRQ